MSVVARGVNLLGMARPPTLSAPAKGRPEDARLSTGYGGRDARLNRPPKRPWRPARKFEG